MDPHKFAVVFSLAQRGWFHLEAKYPHSETDSGVITLFVPPRSGVSGDRDNRGPCYTSRALSPAVVPCSSGSEISGSGFTLKVGKGEVPYPYTMVTSPIPKLVDCPSHSPESKF